MDNYKKYDLKVKIIKNIFKSISKNSQFENINFKSFKKISPCKIKNILQLSKYLSAYMDKHKIHKISNDTIILSIKKFICNKKLLKFYIRNIERIKFYVLLFNDKSCSHLVHYILNNYNINQIKKSNKFISIVIGKEGNYSIILNENLDVTTSKCNKTEGNVFKYKKRIYIDMKYKISLLFLSIILTQLIIFNIPDNYLILEMNLVVHMKLNNSGNIISLKPKTKSALDMINQTKQINKKMSTVIPNFISYSLDNNILKPGEKIKIYVIGPPLSKKDCENLKNSLKSKPVNIIINNSGSLVKINET